MVDNSKKVGGLYYEVEKYVKIHLIVEDNGRGISPENLPKLFMDFAKLDEHANINQKGTGLGLSICKNIIESMGGKVYAESELNQGTKFNIIVGLKAFDKVYIAP